MNLDSVRRAIYARATEPGVEMTVIRIPYVKAYIDRHGNVRHSAFCGAPCTSALASEPMPENKWQTMAMRSRRR